MHPVSIPAARRAFPNQILAAGDRFGTGQALQEIRAEVNSLKGMLVMKEAKIVQLQRNPVNVAMRVKLVRRRSVIKTVAEVIMRSVSWPV